MRPRAIPNLRQKDQATRFKRKVRGKLAPGSIEYPLAGFPTRFKRKVRGKLGCLRCAQCDTMPHMRPIAHIYTDLPQKFGIPRNSFLAPHLQGRIVFEPEFALDAAVAGLEGFSHLWLIWRFENGIPGGTKSDIAVDSRGLRGAAKSTAISEWEGSGEDAAYAPWSPTVRPPRLGGSERMGVFATRSPFRPNPVGLTCVKLDRIEHTENGPVVHVLGADMRNETPLLDIKPYIPFADCHPDAQGGFINDVPWHELSVVAPDALLEAIPADKRPGLVEILHQDPRRAGSKHDPGRIYHLAYAGFDVSFSVDEDALFVTNVERLS